MRRELKRRLKKDNGQVSKSADASEGGEQHPDDSAQTGTANSTTMNQPTAQTVQEIPPVQDESSNSSSSDSDGDSNRLYMQRFKSDCVVSSLIRQFRKCEESMPDKKDTHLPFNQKNQLYLMFPKAFVTLFPEETIRHFHTSHMSVSRRPGGTRSGKSHQSPNPVLASVLVYH